MAETKKKETKPPEAVEMVKSTTAVGVVNTPKSRPEKGSQEAKDKMAAVRAYVTPESLQQASETRQKNGAFKNALRKAAELKYNGMPIGNMATAIWNKFHENGLENYTDAIAIAMITQAADGNVEAAKFVRDTLGEKPVEETNHGGNVVITLASVVDKEWAE